MDKAAVLKKNLVSRSNRHFHIIRIVEKFCIFLSEFGIDSVYLKEYIVKMINTVLYAQILGCCFFFIKIEAGVFYPTMF